MQASKKKRAQNNSVIYAIVAGSIITAIVVIFLLINGIGTPTVNVNYDAIPVTRTDDDAFVLGDPAAPLTLVAWEDFRCSHCLDYEPTLQQFIKDYVETGKVKFEFRMLQTASPDDTMFRLLQCTGEQQPDLYYKARYELFSMTARGWSAATSPRTFAERLDLNYSDILSCTSDVTQMATDSALAQSVGISGTPALATRDAAGRLTVVPQQQPSYNNLKTYIDGLLLLS